MDVKLKSGWTAIIQQGPQGAVVDFRKGSQASRHDLTSLVLDDEIKAVGVLVLPVAPDKKHKPETRWFSPELAGDYPKIRDAVKAARVSDTRGL